MSKTNINSIFLVFLDFYKCEKEREVRTKRTDYIYCSRALDH